MSEGRLRRLRPDDLDDDQRALYERILSSPRAKHSSTPIADQQGCLRGPFNAMLYQPQIGELVQQLGSALRYGKFSPRTSETAILEIARLRSSEYEWAAHEQTAREAGFTDSEIDALRTGADVPNASEEERLVRSAAKALVVNGDLDDETVAALLERFGEAGVFSFISLVGYYSMIATNLAVFRVGPPEGATPVFTAGSRL
jgi:4-carboxymuconolactone decarboxylase